MDAGGVDLAHKIQRTFTAGDLVRRALDLRQDVARVGVELVDGVDVTGVEGQGDHGTDLGEVHAHAAVVVGDVCRIKLAVIVRASVVGKVATRVIVRTPNGGEAGGLRGHDVHAVADVRGHGRDAGAHKLHHLVLDVAAREDGSDDGERHVLRANKGLAGTLKVDGDNIRGGNVVGLTQQLLYQLAAALANRHGAQGAVARVGVRSKDHLAAAGHHLAHVLVDNGHVRGYVDAAVVLCGGETKEVVVLVDGAADGAQGVMAGGEHVGHGELLKTARLGGLDNAHVGDVMAGEAVEGDLEARLVPGGVVGLHDAVGDGAAACFLAVGHAARKTNQCLMVVLGYNGGAL